MTAATGQHQRCDRSDQDRNCRARKPGIFREDKDVEPGKSKVTENQAHLDRAGFLVVVLTPEALLSKLAGWWSSFNARAQAALQPGRIVPLLLVDTPIPPALSDIQLIDFRHKEDYLAGLSSLIETLGRRVPTAEQLGRLHVPSPPRPGLPPILRKQLIKALSPLVNNDPSRRLALAGLFGLPPNWAGGPFTSSPECAASALLVLAAPDQPREAALRVVRELQASELEVERPELDKFETALLDLAVAEHGDLALAEIPRGHG